MRIEIQGQDAVSAAKELVSIEGLEVHYQVSNEIEREGVLAVIATVVGIIGGAATIADKIYSWHEKLKKSRQSSSGLRVEKVLLVGTNGRRLLLEDATLDEIKSLME